MLRKMLLFLMFGFMVIAFLLSLFGVTSIGTGEKWNVFLRSFSTAFNSWSFKIPSIPKVKNISKPSGQVVEIITALIWIVNMFIALLNGIITMINVLVMVMNFVISIFQFVLTFIYCIKDFFNSLGVQEGSSLFA